MCRAQCIEGARKNRSIVRWSYFGASARRERFGDFLTLGAYLSSNVKTCITSCAFSLPAMSFPEFSKETSANLMGFAFTALVMAPPPPGRVPRGSDGSRSYVFS